MRPESTAEVGAETTQHTASEKCFEPSQIPVLGYVPEPTRLTNSASPISSLREPVQDEEAKIPYGTELQLIPTEITYPEGGLQAWLVVFGSWCGLVAGLGIANTIASFQSYVLANQLKDYDAGTVGWIFSIYAFLAFACGLVIGPVFDRYGPRYLVIVGCTCVCACLFILGECTAYWHFLVVFGIVGGVGTSLLFTPCIASIGHFFNRGRGNATGIAATGGAVGGIIFPLVLEDLIPKVGFAWSCRIIGFIFLSLCLAAILLIKSRLPPKPNSNAKPDFRIFRNKVFAITVAGVYLIEWALFVPLTYISSYAIAQGFSLAFSYHVLVILNVGSVFGRWLPGLFADRIGRFNASIIALALTIFSVFVIWLPFGHTKPGLVMFALIFGFASGSNISLTPVCVGQLCDTRDYGRWYATCYTIVSVGCLTGIPIVGEILKACDGHYWGLIVFVGLCYVGALVTFVVARVMQTGWKLMEKY